MERELLRVDDADFVSIVVEADDYQHSRTLIEKEYHTVLKQIDPLKMSLWNFYRNVLNPYNFRHPKFNRALFKIWEILHQYSAQLPDSLETSLHLCEAPGSFVFVINQLRPQTQTWSVSLPSDGNLVFVPDVEEHPKNTIIYEDIRQPRVLDSLPPGPFGMITADGGIDDSGCFAQKESLHLDLITSEIVLTLYLLKAGGTFILKTFEWFQLLSIQWLFVLMSSFDKVIAYKPKTSRPTNSERYLICLGFRERARLTSDQVIRCLTDVRWYLSTSQAPRLTHQVPDHIYRHLVEINTFFIRAQIKTLRKVLYMIKTQKFLDEQHYLDESRACWQRWSDDTAFPSEWI